MQTLSLRDKEQIKKIFDQRLASIDQHFKARVTTSVDFDDDAAYPGFALQKFREVTGASISGSTLERLLGLQGGASKPHRGTIEPLLKFLDFDSPEELFRYLKKQRKFAKKIIEIPFSINAIFEGHYLKIYFESSNIITIKHYMNSSFIVISSVNSKFHKNDLIKISALSIGGELICNDVKRRADANQYIELGGYRSGSNNCVTRIHIVKPQID